MSAEDRQELYKTMVSNYSKDLYRFAYRLCGNADTADDILQETFYEAWRSIHSLKDVNKAKAWLFQILRYRYAHWIRDKSRRLQANLSIEHLESVLSLPDENVFETLSNQEILQKALGSLDDRYKEPFLMVFLQDMSCKEAAQELKIPIGTVLSRIHRARLLLRKVLKKLTAQN